MATGDEGLTRQLPASPDAERSILGAILLDCSAYLEVAEWLRADEFSLSSNRKIYRTVAEMMKQGLPVDLITLSEWMRDHKTLDAVGGAGYLASLTNGILTRSNIQHYAKIVKDKSLLRGFINVSNNGIARALEQSEPISTILADTERALSEARCKTNFAAIDLDKFPDPLELSVEPEPWLVPDLILKGGVTVLAGAPGEGKSWQALAIARAVALQGEYLGRKCEAGRVVIFDFENPRAVIQQRWQTMFGGPAREYGVTFLAPWSGMGAVPMIGDARLAALAEPGRLFIFDTLSGAHSAKEENSSSEMAPILGQFRDLANKGASILLLHHRGKSELSKYRGSSAIAGGIDVGCALLKGEDGLLTLEVFKTRGGADFKVTFRPDYERGEFELADSEPRTGQRDDTKAVLEAIAVEPGITQAQLVERLGRNRNSTCGLLKAHQGELWRVERGPRGALKYFPMTCTEVYRPVPGTTAPIPAVPAL